MFMSTITLKSITRIEQFFLPTYKKNCHFNLKSPGIYYHLRKNCRLRSTYSSNTIIQLHLIK
jgi:hypothetical protein